MSYGRGGYHNSSAPSATPVGVEILGWNGASKEECIGFIARKSRITVFNYLVDANGVLKGFVKTPKEASDLLALLGFKFAGQVLKISRAAGSLAPAGDNNTIATITNFLRGRFDPNSKLLNLLAVHQDASLASKGFFASISTTSKFFPALMKVASELNFNATSVDLLGNNLSDLSTISALAQTFPTLQNLSLLHNNFARLKTFETWRHKLNCLRELILAGNPLVNTSNPRDQQNIRTELMKLFPRLVVLDGQPLRNEQVLVAHTTFSFDAPQPMFFLDEEIQGVATNFIANFYKLWDASRPDLMVLYQAELQFSMLVDLAHPHTIGGSGVASGPDFSYYLLQSRNLTRVSGAKSRMSRVATGQEQIHKLFSQLPKTRHDLIQKPHLFSMEAYRFPQLNGILITLHGSFDEVAAPDNTDAILGGPGNRGRHSYQKKKVSLGPKSFDRTLVIVLGPNGSMIVASDLLLVRPPSGSDAFSSTRDVAGSVPPTPSPSPAPGPSAADLPQEVKAGLNPIQQDILVKVLVETKLTIQYGVMLCEQSGWDWAQCMANFKSSAGGLPREAFA